MGRLLSMMVALAKSQHLACHAGCVGDLSGPIRSSVLRSRALDALDPPVDETGINCRRLWSGLLMNLLKAASTVSLWTLLSRVAGLVRDLLIAGMFGASAVTDAFNVAFRIPNLLRRLFAEGAFSSAFVPILAATREREGDEATHRMINAVATVLFWVLVITCVIGMVASPAVVWLFGAGLERFDLAVVMTRWMFPYIGFMSMVALAAGVLNTWKNFAIPAATPVMLNLAMILCALFLAPWFRRHGIEPIHALSIGVLLGGVLQLGLQLPALAKLHTLPRLGMTHSAVRASWHHPGVRRVLKQMAPALLGVSVAQVSLLINTQIASHLGPGAVSWLFYADRLMEFPTALLGVALGVVLIPGLSALRARGDLQGYSSQLDWGLRLVFMLALPCSMAMLCFARPMVAVLFHHGQFSAHAVGMTVLALQGYGVGLLGIIAVKVLAPGFFAQQDLRTPVRIAIFVLVSTQLMNAVFVPWLGHAGLALSIGLGAIINASWLLIGLRRKGIYRVSPGWGVFVLRLVPANLLLAVWFFWVNHAFDWLGGHGLGHAAMLAGAIMAGGVLYFVVLFASGIRRTDFVRSA